MSQEDTEDRNRANLAKALKMMKENLPLQLELIAIQAHTARVRYVRLIEQGFSPDEALQLCTKSVQL
jgi:hypothetical protein